MTGPYEKRPALDEVVQMMSGLAYMTGSPGQPLRAGASIVDIMGGHMVQWQSKMVCLKWRLSLWGWNASRRFGLTNKGDIAEGFDADLVLFEPDEQWTIHGQDSFSTQGYTPFEGIDVTEKVKTTFVRGHRVFDNNEIVGEMVGEYIHRGQQSSISSA